ncbi:hypothetical protein [Chroococcidiopsis sp. SAG 2025]|uniref:hypothetical protein n=1 Tax=Chroococcidiopsis sp. SAG 2025 TaxID=171389 RepID=UPI00293720EB|nr:hypothetical protein [Chroococcidiopsis sp. SAG 2025]
MTRNMHSDDSHPTIPRRTAIKIMGLAAATTALTPLAFHGGQAKSQTQPNSQQSSQLITKEIPRTQERIPAIGLGTFMAFDVKPERSRDHLQQVMRRFWDAGGRTIDVSPLYGLSEVNSVFCPDGTMDREWRFGFRASPLLDRSTRSPRKDSASSSRARNSSFSQYAL